MFVGAGVMALVLLLPERPQALAIGVVLAAIPVGPLIASYLWLDRYEPEPRSLLLLGLGWGAFVATSAAIFLQAFDAFAFGSSEVTESVLVAPVTEEAAKGLFILLLLVYRRAELDGVLDGIVYAGMVGIGFAFMENILYLSQAYIGEDGHVGGIEGAVGLFVIRGLSVPSRTRSSPRSSASASASRWRAGAGPSRSVAPSVGYVARRRRARGWNGVAAPRRRRAARSRRTCCLMVPAFLVMVGFAIWSRRREGVLLAASLTDCAARGFLRRPRGALADPDPGPQGLPQACAARPAGAGAGRR